MANRVKFTSETKKAFLKALEHDGNVSRVCKAVGISNRCVYNHYQDEPEFREAWDQAVEIAIDGLEREAWRRAVEGVEEDVFYNGEVVGKKKRYSDYLMGRMLSAHRPERFSERRQVEISGSVDHKHSVAPAFDPGLVSQAELETLVKILDKGKPSLEKVPSRALESPIIIEIEPEIATKGQNPIEIEKES